MVRVAELHHMSLAKPSKLITMNRTQRMSGHVAYVLQAARPTAHALQLPGLS